MDIHEDKHDTPDNHIDSQSLLEAGIYLPAALNSS